MAANRQHDITDIVVLQIGNLFAEADDDLVTRAAVLIVVVTVELVVSHHPNADLVVVAVARDKHLGESLE